MVPGIRIPLSRFLEGRRAFKDQGNFFTKNGKLSLKTDEPQISERHEDVEMKRE